ncbi:MAG TPA: hypothetical protein PK191_03505 [Niabella sp.]|nr:hypothetical protein [Niabella sp.]HOZ95408.1 hypothetical protein [Niabella sp.]HQW14297.1 hypothetical protein [Niabella sp.]HQX18423.1 hypothetical protein [Niabella sp.]HQX40085.1 hypothetical protein [Niabella sp.]
MSAQAPDFISVKKRNGITVKSYYAGIDISMITKDGRQYDALIDKVANDSIYLRYFNVYRYVNLIGTISYDTLTTYILPIHYADIKYVLTPKIKYRNGYLRKLGTYAAIGGFGYDFLNVFNGLTQKYQPLFSQRDIRNMAIATGIGALGLSVSNIFRKPQNKYKVVYVNMSLDTKN